MWYFPNVFYHRIFFLVKKSILANSMLYSIVTIAGTLKQPNCPSTEERMKKIQYIYTIYAMEYYSTTKRNEMESSEEMWMDLETVMKNSMAF